MIAALIRRHASAARAGVAILRRVYWPLAIVFLAYAAFRAMDVLPDVIADSQSGLLLCATLLWAALHLLTPALSWCVLRDAGNSIGFSRLLRIHVSRLPARYLPGGIWHTVSRVADLHGMGIPRASLVRLVALENFVPLAVAITLGGTCIAATGDAAAGIPLVVAGATLTCAIPFAVRHAYLGGPTPLSLRGYASIVLVSATFWAVASIAFACYWNAYPAAASGLAPLRIAGAYLLAWAAGFAAIFAPQGVGVFEAVIALLLKGAMPFVGAAVVAAGFRVLVLCADSFAFVLLQLLRTKAWKRVRGH